MKNKQIKRKVLNAVHNSKRYNLKGDKEVVEELLVKKIIRIVSEIKNKLN